MNNLYTISAHLPFADTLAQWILQRWGHDPLVLSRALVLLPSRRATLSLREAFLRAGGGRPMLLPRIEPLGDADEDLLLMSPLGAMPPQDMPSKNFTLRRLFLLARLVQSQRRQMTGRAERMDSALKLAAGLAELMDELEREEISLGGMMDIVPDAFATHWQATVEFLQILSQHWPHIAAEEKLVSPGQHQGQVLRALAAHWRENPPQTPVIAAGTTGSIPSTAALLGAIAGLPDGAVVLPGLDRHSDDNYFAHLEESHPQWGMAQLLQKWGINRKEVQVIGESANARVMLLREVMRPAEVTGVWPAAKVHPAVLEGLSYIPCAGLQEEATTVALLLRETLETPGKTAALVTHNRGLARRVAAIVQRFGIEIDDSAGMPLKETPIAGYLRLVLDAASEGLAPLPLLSLLKHPLTHAGMERIACLEAARVLEKLALRGLRIVGGIEGIRQALLRKQGAPQEVHFLLDCLDEAFAPLLSVLDEKETALGDLVEAHLECADSLGGEALWDGPEAETVSQLLYEIKSACETDGSDVEPDAYPAIFEELLAGKVVRPDYGTHPRLKILSPMEARMQSFDRMILGGLNEGSWPMQVESDPWFSRPMREKLGLPSPERRLGLAAHDFVMLAGGGEVILTRAGKEGGTPTLASRWITKLSMLAGVLPENGQWNAWALALDTTHSVMPETAPAPRPPLDSRPRALSVTKIETWMRDPYALYASQILRLRALEPIGREPDGADFGNAVHKALEDFVRLCPGELPGDALPLLMEQGRRAFEELFAATAAGTLWWPRFARIAQWVVATEEIRRANLKRVRSEVSSSCRIGDFQLMGRADRMEEGRDGSLTIIDYKTGGLPLIKDIEGGLSSQLVLLALIARESGFGTAVIASPQSGRGDPDSLKNKQHWIASSPPAPRNDIALEYWQLLGGEDAGKIKAIDPAKIEGYIAAAHEGLMRLIERYNNPDFPYRSMPIPARASRYSDYDHLARVKEWG